MKNPQVTVLMPVYNGEKYLKEAIGSILNQTFKNFEFLIINDGSTDKSVKIIESYNDNRIKLIHNSQNFKIIKTLNRGIGLAKGKYLARMDCDDISLPGRLEKQFHYLENHPEVGVCGTAFKVIDDNGRDVSVVKFPKTSAVIQWLLFFSNPLAHPTVMMNTSLVKKIGGYRPEALHCEDYDLWFRLTESSKIINLEEVLLCLRKHNKNISALFFKDQQDHVAEISQKIISAQLKENMPLSDIRQVIFKENRSLDQTINTYRIIYKLFQSYIKSKILSKEELRLIKKDVASRIYALTRLHGISLKIWPLYVAVLKFDPTFPLRLI